MKKCALSLCFLIMLSCKTNLKLESPSEQSNNAQEETPILESFRVDTVVISAPANEFIHLMTEKTSANIFLVRHAEKAKDGSKNPTLTEKGQQRAKMLSDFLKDVKLSAVYSTDYNRTKSTAKPTAEDQSLSTTLYNAKELESFANEILKKHNSENILVVGHSNTTPKLVNALTKQTNLSSIDESQYDNLFLLKFMEDGKMHLIRMFFSPDKM